MLEQADNFPVDEHTRNIESGQCKSITCWTATFFDSLGNFFVCCWYWSSMACSEESERGLAVKSKVGNIIITMGNEKASVT